MTPILYVPAAPPRAPEPPVVLALVRERAAAARLADALRSGVPSALVGRDAGAPAQLRVVTRVAELRDALDARAYALVVVEPRDADDVSTEEAVRALRARHPDLPVVGQVAYRRGMSPEILALARAGIHELIVADVDDAAHVLRTTLARAARRSVAERVLADVLPLVPLAALPVLRYTLEHATDAPDVPALARALGVTRQTLAARLRAAGLPGPRTLSIWSRLLLAGELLAGEGRAVDHVALALDFASANAFRNLLRRYADLGPGDVRRDRGAALRAAFCDAIAGRRPAPRETDPLGADPDGGRGVTRAAVAEDGLVPS